MFSRRFNYDLGGSRHSIEWRETTPDPGGDLYDSSQRTRSSCRRPLVGGLCLGPSLLVTPALADEPKLTPQQEWEAHPELVKAIFYRLQMDDAAIDKAQVK